MGYQKRILTDPFVSTLIRIKAHQLCRRPGFSRSEIDDLTQEMYLYLWRKAHLFDPLRGTIEAFVTDALKSWVGMELRRRHRHKRWNGFATVSIETTTIECDGDATPLADLLGESDARRRTFRNRPTPLDLLMLEERVRHGLSQLTAEERELLHHVAEHGVASAARTWSQRLDRNVSRRQIDNALRRMRRHFEDPGLSAV